MTVHSAAVSSDGVSHMHTCMLIDINMYNNSFEWHSNCESQSDEFEFTQSGVISFLHRIPYFAVISPLKLTVIPSLAGLIN